MGCYDTGSDEKNGYFGFWVIIQKWPGNRHAFSDVSVRYQFP